MYRQRRRTFVKGWEREAKSYDKLVGEGGHYFHQHVVIPGVLKLLNLKKADKILDLGCGQGVLARAIPKNVAYLGIDSAKSLVQIARGLNKDPDHSFISASATKTLPREIPNDFTHCTIILALQNMERPEVALQNASDHLVLGGKLVIVLNHPSFRIPRQSGWGENENKTQYRWVNKYMSYLAIPILMHPGLRQSAKTVSFHHPISFYVKTLVSSGFVVTGIEEWVSDRESEGKNRKMENRSRSEIPLFMAMVAEKR